PERPVASGRCRTPGDPDGGPGARAPARAGGPAPAPARDDGGAAAAPERTRPGARRASSVPDLLRPRVAHAVERADLLRRPPRRGRPGRPRGEAARRGRTDGRSRPPAPGAD